MFCWALALCCGTSAAIWGKQKLRLGCIASGVHDYGDSFANPTQEEQTLLSVMCCSSDCGVVVILVFWRRRFSSPQTPQRSSFTAYCHKETGVLDYNVRLTGSGTLVGSRARLSSFRTSADRCSSPAVACFFLWLVNPLIGSHSIPSLPMETNSSITNTLSISHFTLQSESLQVPTQDRQFW